MDYESANKHKEGWQNKHNRSDGIWDSVSHGTILIPFKKLLPCLFLRKTWRQKSQEKLLLFITIIEQIVKAFLTDYPDKSSEKVEIIFNFIFTGIVEAFFNWFTEERKMPLKELEETLEIFTFYGIKEMVYNF